MSAYSMEGLDPQNHPQAFAFKHLIEDFVEDFVNCTKQFNEPLTTMALMVKQAFEAELKFVISGIQVSRPTGQNMEAITAPLSNAIKAIQAYRDKNRHVEEFFNHMSTISESIVALGWVSVLPAPMQFVQDLRESGEYFGNRVLATHRGERNHATWVNKWSEVLKQLEQYVKEYHRTGFAWGVSKDPIEIPLAPPPPPPGPFVAEPMAGGDDRLALLNELNQGVGITRMLRPVRRTDGVVPTAQTAVAQPVAAPRGAQAAAVRTYPPKFIVDGKKWRVEHIKDNYSMLIDEADMSQSLAMFKCENSGLEVKNKMNGVTLDNCKRTTVVLSDIISSVEAIRCDRLKIQCNGHVPLISLDNCDSIQIFVTEKSQDAEIISSKSTSCNVCLLAPDGDYVELAMPEQIKTVVAGRSLHSSVVEKI